MSHLYSALPQIFHHIKGALQLQVPPQLRPFTVSFFCEEEPPPPRSTPLGAYRSQGCHIMGTQSVQWSYSVCTYSSTHHHYQVPILHLGEVRQAQSSHLAEGCYMVSQLDALRFEPTTCTFKVPHAIHLATTSPLSQRCIFKFFFIFLTTSPVVININMKKTYD